MYLKLLNYGDGVLIIDKSNKFIKVRQLVFFCNYSTGRKTPTNQEQNNNEKDDFTSGKLSYKEVMLNSENYKRAYTKIKSKPGNMTPGGDNETLDGFSNQDIDKVIKDMKDRSFKFKPSKRIYIPKKNGKLRPLGIPSPRDKIVQEVFREAVEKIYEPLFRETSHGFRPNKSCKTAI